MSTLRISHSLLILLTATALTACLGGSGGSSSRDRAPDFSLATLSSAPDQVSGGDVLVTIEGSVFKCTLKSVDTALADGTYGSWVPTPGQVDRLKEIFPQGVCDYSKPDQGRPGA